MVILVGDERVGTGDSIIRVSRYGPLSKDERMENEARAWFITWGTFDDILAPACYCRGGSCREACRADTSCTEGGS
jgi:hypothetical protein